MDATTRTFIAINFNPKIQNSIKYIQDHLKKTDCDINWVKPENIHMTIKFLGPVRLTQIDAIKQALANLFKNTKPFNIELEQLGAFPNMVHPRALWVGLKDTKQKLNRMATSLEKALQKMGFEKDQRTFNPHITIGRVRSSKNISDLSRSMPDCHASGNLTQTISGITLFKSTLNQDGPTYEPLYQVKFMN